MAGQKEQKNTVTQPTEQKAPTTAQGKDGKADLKGANYDTGQKVLSPKADGASYTVKPGDTLSGIARSQLGDQGRWKEIAEANKVTNPAAIKVGQVLFIPGAKPAHVPAGGGGQPQAENKTESKDAENKDAENKTAEQKTDAKDTEKDAKEDAKTETEVDATTTGGTKAPKKEDKAKADGTTQHLVTDGKALLRKAPPDLGSTGKTIPAGTSVVITATATHKKKSYVYVAEALPKGVQGPPKPLGWTSKANLAGFEGGGPEIENDASLRPDDAILLKGLSGLKRTMAVIYNAKGKYLHEQAKALGISTAAAAAALKVESNGHGFGSDGKMTIRFENHVFKGQWGASNPKTFAQHFKYGGKNSKGKTASYLGHYYRQDPKGKWVKVHAGQGREWEVLKFARSLSDEKALRSISMGAAQVMGFNYKKEGFKSAREMFDKMSGAIKPQLSGFFSFVQNTPVALAGLKAKNYVKFAGAYNGKGKSKDYGGKIASAASAWETVTKGHKYA